MRNSCRVSFKDYEIARHEIIGCKDKRLAPVLRDLIQTSNFRVVVVEDCETVEVCGALKASRSLSKEILCVNYFTSDIACTSIIFIFSMPFGYYIRNLTSISFYFILLINLSKYVSVTEHRGMCSWFCRWPWAGR